MPEIIVSETEVPCRFGCKREPAVVRVRTSSGCACFPEDEEQDLCIQHVISAEPLGTFELIAIYQPELYELVKDRLD